VLRFWPFNRAESPVHNVEYKVVPPSHSKELAGKSAGTLSGTLPKNILTFIPYFRREKSHSLGHSTIKDIAKKLNLSTSTVSRALRDRYDVNPETRRKVMQAAEELNYLPSSQALGLLKQKTLTIGVVVPEIDNPFFSQAIHGIENIAFEHDYHILICQTRDDEIREAKVTEKLLSSRVDGIIISMSAESKDLSHLQRILKHGVPLVLFDRTSKEIDTHKVLNDDYTGALEAVTYLIEKGYRRIGHLAGPDSVSVARDRRRGYEDALKHAGIDINPDLILSGNFRQQTGKKNAAYMIQNSMCDALFCVSDPVAIGALVAARHAGLEIPADLAILGFSNLAITEFLEPSLSTVAQPAYKMGREAAKLLLESISQPEKNRKSQIRVLNTELVIRDST